MEITKPNDILIATINNPMATTYDLSTINLNPANTGLLTKDQYKSTKYVQDTFKTVDGAFDDIAFNETYAKAANHYGEMSNEAYLKGLDEIAYSPFDVTRPKDAKTFKIDVEFTKDFNPFQQLYNRTAVGSIDSSPLSLREIAQQGKIFNTKEQKWSDTSANDLGLLDKIFGDTLVYGQWDEDGIHKDVQTGLNTKHTKGDWKINNDGNIFIETLGDREIYGKQVVNPKDILTTDGSFSNNLDFFDNDNIESNAIKTTFKLAAEIAPLLIPGVNLYYGGVKAAIGLAGVLPTFYKSLESMFLGDTKTGLTDLATRTEGYLAKFNQNSVSDEAQGSFLNYEQLGSMVADTFGQLYEQRAVASLSKYFVKAKSAALIAKEAELESQIGKGLFEAANSGKVSLLNKAGKLSDEAAELVAAARMKLPELESLQKLQSGIAKSLSLGYMAMTSTADIYGEALAAGYDRRTAGFSALLAASGQYGIMVNNRMGDWFLDGTTGYSLETNKTLMRKATKDYMGKVQEAFKVFGKDKNTGKKAFSDIVKGYKDNITDLFTNGSVVGEAMWKNALVEGVEEVTEQAVLDSTKAIVDAMSYLGMTEKKGNFNAINKTFSKEGAQEYLANFVGGILGGAMFEFNTSKIEPLFNKNLINPNTQKTIQQYVANGHTDLLIDMVNKQRTRLGNNYLSPIKVDGMYIAAENNKSQADFIADSTIQFIRNQDGIINGKDWGKSDAEIVEKTMMDQIAIKMFNDSKGDNKIGIEGLLIDDFNNNREAFLKVESQLKDLSQDPTANKDAIAALKEEAKIYEDNINDMLSGKKAEEYFKEASFYFEKEISGNFLQIDRDSFSKAKYGKSYNELVDKGVGITKERVNSEWKEALNSTDVRKNIKTASRVYFEIEKMLNPSIDKYTKGYSEEHKKSLENIFKTAATLNLYDVSDPETKKETIRSTIESAKKIEQATGKRVLPYDVLATDFVEQFFKMNLLGDKDGKLLTEDDLNRLIKVEEGEDISLKTAISNLIENTLIKSPSSSFIYNIIEKEANTLIDKYNDSILQEIIRIESTRNEENTLEVDDKITSLENKQINAKLLNYKDTDVYQKLKTTTNKIIVDEQDKLGLTAEDLNMLSGVSNLEDKPSIKLNLEYIIDSDGTTSKELSVESQTDLMHLIELDKIKNEKGISLLEEFYTLYQNDPSNDNFQKLEDKVKETEDEIQLKSKAYNKLKEFEEKENGKLSKELEKAMPSYFSPKGSNYALPALLKEIKTNNNLDKEVFKLVENSIDDFLLPIKNMFIDFNISKLELLDLLQNSEKYFATLENILNGEIVSNDVKGFIGELDLSNLPNYIKNAIKSLPDNEYSVNSASIFSEGLLNLSDFKKINKEDYNNIEEVIKVLNDSDKFISNSLYDFIENFEVTLTGNNDTLRKSNIMKILKNEEYSLFKASDITNYFAEGVRLQDIDQVLNTLNLIKAVVKSMSTTEISLDSSTHGFLAMRQNFAERNKIKSDVTALKTITSDTANMMLLDLARIESKLNYLKELAKSNSGKLFNESEEIRTIGSALFHKGWIDLSKKPLIFKGKPVIPDLSSILNSNDSKEKQLLNIKDSFFKEHINLNDDEKIELLKLIKEEYPHSNIYDNLYSVDGNDEFTKEMKELSNHDFFWSIASSLVVNSKDIYKKILSNLQGEFDKAPFYTQELAAEMLYASVVNPKIFSALLPEEMQTNLTDFITYVLGNAGTGKTTVEFKLLLLMLRTNNPNLSIWFNGPTSSQAEKLQNDVTDKITTDKFTMTTLDKGTLFEKLGLTEVWEKLKSNDPELVTYDKDTGKYSIKLEDVKFKTLNDLPNLILIDETTHYTALELELLNEFSKRLYNNGVDGKYMKIVSAGDPTQRGAKVENVSYNVDRVNGFYTPILNLTVRASNSQKRENNDSLSASVKKAAKLFINTDNSPKVLELLNKGVNFKYYFDNNDINGDMLTETAELPISVVNTLKNTINKNSKIQIGILSKDGKLSDDLTAKFKTAGITSANYTIYTPNNVQGKETDYFIFDISDIADSHIMAALRNLYTYMSRAKKGSIILGNKNVKNEDNTTIPIISTKEDHTEPFEPMTPIVIEEIKLSKIEQLKELLDGEFDIKYDDFKFDNNNVTNVNSTTIIESTIETEEEDVEDESTKGIPTTERKEKFLPDESKLMLHTFYNDINIEVSDNGDGTSTITKNNKSTLNTGLGFLFNDEESKKIIDTIELEDIAAQLLSLKYKVLGDLNKLALTDSILLNHDQLFKGSITRLTKEIVIRKTVYSEIYNKPYKKQIDSKDKHLNSGDIHPNLYLKVSSQNKTYYLHLGSLPEIQTTINSFGPDSNTTKYYTAFLENNINEEITVPKDKVGFFTNTRLLYHKDAKGNRIRIQNMNINELESLESKGTSLLNITTKYPGLSFYNGKSFSSSPTIKLYPTDFNDYVRLFKGITFNEEMQTEEALRSRFKLDSGKPYIAVSYVQDKNQVRYLKLISANRTIKQLKEIFKNPFNSENPESISKLIRGDINKEDALKIGESMFSGPQVLDMLVSLATENPELFKQFFTSGDEFLKTLKEALIKDKAVKTNVTDEIFKTLFDEKDFNNVNKDFISTIFYQSSDGKLRSVLNSIRKEIEKGKPIDATDLRKILLPVVGNSSNKYWFHKFWNIIRVSVESETLVIKDNILKEKLESFNKVVNAMIKHWEQVDRYYYNLPITTVTKTNNVTPYNMESNKSNLYTTLVPEGPRMFLDLKEIFENKKKSTPQLTPPEVTSEVTSEEKAKQELELKKAPIIENIVKGATDEDIQKIGYDDPGNRINFATWLNSQSLEDLEKFERIVNEDEDDNNGDDKIDLEANRDRIAKLFDDFIEDEDVNGDRAHHKTISYLFNNGDPKLISLLLKNLDNTFILEEPVDNPTTDKLIEKFGTNEVSLHTILEDLSMETFDNYAIEMEESSSAAQLANLFYTLFPEIEPSDANFTECQS